MIEKAQRTIGCQRREPEREPCELDRHGVQIDAVQAAFGDGASDGCAFGLPDVAGQTAARVDKRRFVCAREVPARRHEKRAAAHGRIDDPEPENAVGRQPAHERRERAPDDEVGDRLRCVERAGRFSNSGSRLQRHRLAIDDRRVVEQGFIDGAELLDA